MSNPDPKPSGLIQVRDNNSWLLWLSKCHYNVKACVLCSFLLSILMLEITQNMLDRSRVKYFCSLDPKSGRSEVAVVAAKESQR